MRHAPRQAQAMVEFALLAPLFFILLFGLVDFGRAIYFYNSIAHGAREAARYAVVMDNGGATDVAIRQQARFDLFSVPVDASTSCSPDLCAIPSTPVANQAYVQVAPNYDARQALQAGTLNPGVSSHYPLTITVTFYFRPVTPIIAQLVGNTLNLTVQSTMVTEY
jgi:Flp pilus assembly protein TadG